MTNRLQADTDINLRISAKLKRTRLCLLHSTSVDSDNIGSCGRQHIVSYASHLHHIHGPARGALNMSQWLAGKLVQVNGSTVLGINGSWQTISLIRLMTSVLIIARWLLAFEDVASTQVTARNTTAVSSCVGKLLFVGQNAMIRRLKLPALNFFGRHFASKVSLRS